LIEYKVIDVSEYSPSQKEMERAVIRALIEYNWDIEKQSSENVEATYKEKQLVNVLFGAYKLFLAGGSIHGDLRSLSLNVNSLVYVTWIKVY